MRLYAYLEAHTERAKYGRQAVHARIALGREHAMKALVWFIGQLCKLLETYCGVDQVAQDEAGDVGLAIEERRGGLIQ